MFSEEDSSGEKIDIYVKMFLPACNAFGKAVKNSNEREKDCNKNNEENTFFSSTTNFFSLLNMTELVQLHGSVKEI